MGELPLGLREGLADRYTLERELGRGGMAVVYLLCVVLACLGLSPIAETAFQAPYAQHQLPRFQTLTEAPA
jgi:hypothetical protein